MAIFIFFMTCALVALIPAAAAGGIYWAALRDARAQEDACALWLASRFATTAAPQARRAGDFLREMRV